MVVQHVRQQLLRQPSKDAQPYGAYRCLIHPVTHGRTHPRPSIARCVTKGTDIPPGRRQNGLMPWTHLVKPTPSSIFLYLAIACWGALSFLHVTGVAAGGLPPRTLPAARGVSSSSDVGRNLTFEVEGERVTLVDGLSETPAAPEAPGSAASIVTRYFGNAASGDLDGDGLADTAFLITQSRGGSGTFFYVVVALTTPAGHTGTNAILLGDRIAPQSLTIVNRTLVVPYAVRAPGTPLSSPPTLGVSQTLRLVGPSLIPIP